MRTGRRRGNPSFEGRLAGKFDGLVGLVVRRVAQRNEDYRKKEDVLEQGGRSDRLSRSGVMSRFGVESMLPEVARLAEAGQSVLYLAINNDIAGLIGVEDLLRRESPEIIRSLREYGVRRIVMLTGDGKRSAAAVARRLGIDEYRAQVLPTDKAEIVTSLKDEGFRVLMIGDGINDSPALSAADAGATLRDGAGVKTAARILGAWPADIFNHKKFRMQIVPWFGMCRGRVPCCAN